MLQALVASTEPRLQWMGLDYDSDRARRLAAGMVETLEFFEVPAADRLAGLHDALADLARRCRDQDLDGAKRAAAALRSEIARLPRPAGSLESAVPDAERRIDNPRRDVLVALADEVLSRAKAKGLAGLEARIEESMQSLAGDLRPFLAAPAYVVPLAAGRGSLLQDRELVRKHRLVCVDPAQDRAWSDAVLQRDTDNHAGVSICGHVGTVDLAISSFTLSTTQLRTGRGLDERRAQAWYHHLNATRWHLLEPPLTAAVAGILELGWALLDLAIHEAPAGPQASLAATVVPRARLERAARDSPSRAALTRRGLDGRRRRARSSQRRSRDLRRGRRAGARARRHRRARLRLARPTGRRRGSRRRLSTAEPARRSVGGLPTRRSISRGATRRWSSVSWSTSTFRSSAMSAARDCPASSDPT